VDLVKVSAVGRHTVTPSCPLASLPPLYHALRYSNLPPPARSVPPTHRLSAGHETEAGAHRCVYYLHDIEESQQPTWPQARHSRRCTQCRPPADTPLNRWQRASPLLSGPGARNVASWSPSCPVPPVYSTTSSQRGCHPGCRISPAQPVPFVFLMLRRPGPPYAPALRSKFEVWTNQISRGAATRRAPGPEVKGPIPPISAQASSARSALVVLLVPAPGRDHQLVASPGLRSGIAERDRRRKRARGQRSPVARSYSTKRKEQRLPLVVGPQLPKRGAPRYFRRPRPFPLRERQRSLMKSPDHCPSVPVRKRASPLVHESTFSVQRPVELAQQLV
jgi:hypothetical protein